MEKNLYDLSSEDGKNQLEEDKNYDTPPWIDPEEFLAGFVQKTFAHSDGDGNVYEIVFKQGDDYFKTLHTEYEMAGHTSWGEELVYKREIDKSVTIDVIKVKQVTTELIVYEPIA